MLNRKTEDIQELLTGVRELYGPDCVEPYGEVDDPQSVGFIISGIPATFSIIVADRLPALHYNVQIESYPPTDLDYLYCAPAISLWGFLDVAKRMSGPKRDWPVPGGR